MADITISPEFQRGLEFAKLAMLEIEAHNKLAASLAEDLDLQSTSSILNKGLSLPGDAREGFVYALAEFVGLALDGCVIIPGRWKPLN